MSLVHINQDFSYFVENVFLQFSLRGRGLISTLEVHSSVRLRKIFWKKKETAIVRKGTWNEKKKWDVFSDTAHRLLTSATWTLVFIFHTRRSLPAFDICFFIWFLLAEQIFTNRTERDTGDVSDEDKIAMSGKPKLGAISKVQVVIRESDEFKVSQVGTIFLYL